MTERSGGGSGKEYVDFEIQLERLDDAGGQPRYEVKAKCRGGTARHELSLEFGRERRLRFNVENIGDLVTQIEQAVYYGRQPRLARGVAVVDAPGENGAGGADAALSEFGHDLYTALMQGKVARLFDRVSGQVEGLRIRLSLNLTDPYQRALSRIPWECMKEDPRPDLQFLSAIESSPFVRDVEIGEPLDKPRVKGALKILLVTANPPGSAELGLDDEERVIQETFENLQRDGLVVVDELRDASWEELSSHLNRHDDYHVIHYMGHGHYDAKRGGMLLLQGKSKDGEEAEVDRVDAEQLALMLKEKTRHVRLMFINACNTGVETKGTGAPFGGLATKILETGIPAVIAMQFMIEDNSAIRFAKAFYECIAINQPVDQAVSYARQMELITKRQNEDKANHWLTPVLYMRAGEDGFLFHGNTDDDDTKHRGVGAEEIPGLEARPEPADPPPWVETDGDYALWFTEWRNKLVLNWRLKEDAGYGDLVALFDGEPRFPYNWLGVQYETAKDEQLFVTNKSPRPDRYYVAYLRQTDDGYEIVKSYGPYSREPGESADVAAT